MFNVGAGEIALIMVAALLVLGPKRLPELARGLGKFLREFRRQTDDVRSMVEREFYKMDQELETPPATPSLPEGSQPAPMAVLPEHADPTGAHTGLDEGALRADFSADPHAVPLLPDRLVDDEATVIEGHDERPHPPVPGAPKLPHS